jgi:hypothetical protein
VDREAALRKFVSRAQAGDSPAEDGYCLWHDAILSIAATPAS